MWLEQIFCYLENIQAITSTRFIVFVIVVLIKFIVVIATTVVIDEVEDDDDDGDVVSGVLVFVHSFAKDTQRINACIRIQIVAYKSLFILLVVVCFFFLFLYFFFFCFYYSSQSNSRFEQNKNTCF